MWRRLQQRLSRRRVFSVGVLQCAGVLLRPLRGGPHALQRSVARFAGAGRQLGGTDLLPGPEHRSAHCTLHTTLYSSVQVTWWRQSASPGPARPATGTRGRWSAASVTWRARRSLPALLQCFHCRSLCRSAAPASAPGSSQRGSVPCWSVAAQTRCCTCTSCTCTCTCTVQVVMGRCSTGGGGGGHGDCPDNNVHGILCCELDYLK